MPDGGLNRYTSDQNKGVPSCEASYSTRSQLEEILLRRVAAGSMDRYHSVQSFFKFLPPLEAARLYSQLSSPIEPLRKLMLQKLSRKSVPKLIEVLRETAHGYTCRTLPSLLDDQSLEDAFLGPQSTGVAPMSTPIPDPEGEDYSQEAFEEMSKRGLAKTVVPDYRLEEIRIESEIQDASNSGDYSKVDWNSMIQKMKGPTDFLGLISVGYFRWLEVLSDGSVIQIQDDPLRGPNAGTLIGGEEIHKEYLDPKKEFLVVRLPLEVQNQANEIKYYYIEIWWIAYDADEFKIMDSFADGASRGQEHSVAFMLRPVIGDAGFWRIGFMEAVGSFNIGGGLKIPKTRMGMRMGGWAKNKFRFKPKPPKPPTPVPPSQTTQAKKPQTPSASPVSVPKQKPRTVSKTVNLSGETAGTGGIKEIRAERRADGSLHFEMDGELKEPIKRRKAPNFQNKIPSGKDVGTPGYERAHMWGPGFGDEARDGITLAPRKVNQIFQNRGAEDKLRQLHKLAAQKGATIQVTVKASTHPPKATRGHEYLKDASYRFDVKEANGKTHRLGQVDITVPAPGAKGKVEIHVTGGSFGAWSL